ncbi:Pectin lyase-like protein [Glarea lozoyensis ATCC 20868]|uniref:Pectate lyase n=2 Tax=Glarea lozoyensis TaxID=101852 RepID=S3D376_GLAL2|nr:Pectin lyase-like protein [Glarea lozoyensis ATCC 20868]EHK97044.1 putative Pectate lyase H [Glarea lozoyensis 74030]EPE32240.1 Pectin lyase-like protein [Glarea lozoyensis ATCC 20868]
MKFSNVQLAILAFSLGVSAAPSNKYTGAIFARECDDEVTSTAVSSATFTAPVNLAAETSEATTKKASKTSKAKTTKTKATEATTATDAADDADDVDADVTTTSKAKSASATPAASDAASSKTGKASSAATTASPTTGSSSGSSGGSLPASSGTSVLSAAQTIAAGGSFDGGMTMFDRGVSCTGQAEGGDSDAVFNIEEGGSLSNVIIGPNQIEGVHCQGACTLTNVWWSAVCEDAFTIKLQDAGATTTINGGGAFGAEDKVIQHNGAGTVVINDFTADTFGKLYRSCGNCKASNERHVVMKGVSASNGDILVGINSNFGDTATLDGSKITSVKTVCQEFEGTTPGNEPATVDTKTSCLGADGQL